MEIINKIDVKRAFILFFLFFLSSTSHIQICVISDVESLISAAWKRQCLVSQLKQKQEQQMDISNRTSKNTLTVVRLG